MENQNAYSTCLRWQRQHECMFQMQKGYRPVQPRFTPSWPRGWVGYIYGSAIFAQNNHHFMCAVNQNFGASDGEYRQQIDYLCSSVYAGNCRTRSHNVAL